MLLILLVIVGSVMSGPGYKYQPKRKNTCPRASQAFLDLLPEDYSDDEYEALLDVFTKFLDILPLDEDYNALLDSFEEFLVASRPDVVDFSTRECTPKDLPYRLEDPDQCDKYWECSKKGRLSEYFCEDGLVYDHPGRSCNHIQRVECAERTKLQEPQPTAECPRRNGFYHDEDDIEKCDKYITCTDGLAIPGKCSTGLVWSHSVLACTLPGKSGRPDCKKAFQAKLEFICPDKPPRFGNHDRLSHPKDCGKFYVCFPAGDFNRASCNKPLVFHEESGSCKPAEEVEGCEDYVHFDG